MPGRGVRQAAPSAAFRQPRQAQPAVHPNDPPLDLPFTGLKGRTAIGLSSNNRRRQTRASSPHAKGPIAVNPPLTPTILASFGHPVTP